MSNVHVRLIEGRVVRIFREPGLRKPYHVIPISRMVRPWIVAIDEQDGSDVAVFWTNKARNIRRFKTYLAALDAITNHLTKGVRK